MLPTRGCRVTTNRAVSMIVKELSRAKIEHPPMFSFHEGYAILLEEMDELWSEIKKKKVNPMKVKKEAIQVAAMAMRFLVDLTYE